MVVTIQTPEPGRVEAWQMLGYLERVLEDNGIITAADWNAAIQSQGAK